MAAQYKIRKDLIKHKRKEIRDRSISKGRSQTRAAERVEGVTYADSTKADTKKGPLLTDENKGLMTIIMSAIVYSHYMETIILGSFQSNMDLIYKENGLKPIKFPKHTPMGNFAEMYSNILRQQLVDDQTEQEVREPGDAETFEEVDMEIATSKRGRESPTYLLRPRNRKRKGKRCHGSSRISPCLHRRNHLCHPPPLDHPRSDLRRKRNEVKTWQKKYLRRSKRRDFDQESVHTRSRLCPPLLLVDRTLGVQNKWP